MRSTWQIAALSLALLGFAPASRAGVMSLSEFTLHMLDSATARMASAASVTGSNTFDSGLGSGGASLPGTDPLPIEGDVRSIAIGGDSGPIPVGNPQAQPPASPVPEPATLALLAVGLLVLRFSRSRRAPRGSPTRMS